MNTFKIIECPRDAMQGIANFIPTELKQEYLNELLKVGFDTLDFGSFVSPKAVPQLADTAEVLAGLDLSSTKTKLLAIIANLRGAEDAVKFPEIAYLGYPFSISETFQVRNTHKSIADSYNLMKSVIDLAHKFEKELVVYISMGFGNPYGNKWSVAIVERAVENLYQMGVRIISLADTVGRADEKNINALYLNLIPKYLDVEFGAHFHSHPKNWETKIKAAYEAGCRRFDSALNGFGGCPFAGDALVGNIATENILNFAQSQNEDLDISNEAFMEAQKIASKVFS